MHTLMIIMLTPLAIWGGLMLLGLMTRWFVIVPILLLILYGLGSMIQDILASAVSY